MPKRRERDRPKNAPNSLYNPNKRVLLSYASDEDEETASRQAQPPAPLAPLPPAQPESRPLAPSMPEEYDEDRPENDTAQQGSTGFSRSRRINRANEITGQRAALGSLSYQWEDGCGDEDEHGFDSAEEEAMAYLKAVRHQRQTIPDILATSRAAREQDDIYALGSNDTRGYVEDGAYVARASMGPEIPEHLMTTLEPQEAFTRSLKQRFLAHRRLLQSSPSPGAVNALSDQHPISFPTSNNRAYADWYHFIRRAPPMLPQVQAMGQNTVYNIIELLHQQFLVREKPISSTASAWVWAVLAKLDGVETMSNDQVWTLREFAKKAVLVQLSFDDAQSAKELERMAGGGADTLNPDIGSDDEDGEHTLDGEANTDNGADKNKPVKDDAPRAKLRSNTLATLDSILIVVGDVFGQRDLLEFRRSWSPEDTG